MNPASHLQIVKPMHFISVNVRHSLYFQHARVCHGDWEHCSPRRHPILEVSKDTGSKLIQPLVQFSSSVLSHVRLFVTPWTAAHQASLSITNSRSLLKLMPIELVMPSNHLILCHLALDISQSFKGVLCQAGPQCGFCGSLPPFWVVSSIRKYKKFHLMTVDIIIQAGFIIKY